MLGWFVAVCALPGPSMQLWSASQTSLSSAVEAGVIASAYHGVGCPFHMGMTAKMKAS